MAWVYGCWYKYNRHPLSLLQALEQVLDKGRLSISDASSSGEANYVIQKKRGFRLFATQNPNTGHFRGKREPLSDSLTSR